MYTHGAELYISSSATDSGIVYVRKSFLLKSCVTCSAHFIVDDLVGNKFGDGNNSQVKEK
jgi:hypothetical protein